MFVIIGAYLRINKVTFVYGKGYETHSRDLERINNIILKYSKNIETCNKNKKKCLDELYILASYDNFLKKKYETYECKLDGYINEDKEKIKINEVNKGRNKKIDCTPNNNKIFFYNVHLINDDDLFKRRKNKKKKKKMITLKINKCNHKDKNLHKNEMKDGDHVFSYTKKKWLNNNNNNNNITNMVSFLGYGNIKRKYVTNKCIINEQENNKMDENQHIDKNKNINININLHDDKNDEIRKHSTIQTLYHSNNKEKIISKNVLKDESTNITKECNVNKYDDNIIDHKQKHREKEKKKSIENMNISHIIYEKEQSHDICNVLEENKEEEKYNNLQKDVITNCNNDKVKLEEYHHEKELNNVQIINDMDIKKNEAKKEKNNKKKEKQKNKKKEKQKNKKNEKEKNKKKEKEKNKKKEKEKNKKKEKEKSKKKEKEKNKKKEKEKNNGDVLKHVENNLQDVELLYEEKIINVNTKKDEELSTKNKYSEKDIVHDILSEYSNTLQYTSFLDYMKNRME
ncbi:hypothetical protein PFHG_03630 [Plasmodium falciparum HB3]|uniref:Uncharacterized protein n=1 Tax=Plasmodium falciparum (isolate HB3) TaxID=137071 RepID=A0A0L7KFJ1_PLAFX|nr:hypothetical protein PFHG_03630 [Plasmodium falciparum HB3]